MIDIRKPLRLFLEKRNARRNNLSEKKLSLKNDLLNNYREKFSGQPENIVDVLKKLTTRSKNISSVTKQDIINIEKAIEVNQAVWRMGGLRLGGLDSHTELLAVVCAFFANPNILEIGVANGYSSALFHRIISEKGPHSCIHSIDLPAFEKDLVRSENILFLLKIKLNIILAKIAYPDHLKRPDNMWRGGVIPNDRYCGWLVPMNLRLKLDSKLLVGNAFDILDDLPEQKYNIILLDAMKEEALRLKLLTKILRNAKEGTFILQDGGWRNSAVKNFCEINQFKYTDIGRISVIWVP